MPGPVKKPQALTPSNKSDKERTQRRLPEISRRVAHEGGAVPSFEDISGTRATVFARDKSHLHLVLVEYV